MAVSDRAQDWLTPDWPAPADVRAAFTLRTGGVSAPPFDSLNVGANVGDHPDAVAENRRRILHRLAFPEEPAWLEQVHGCEIADLDAARATARADGSFTRVAGRVCAVQVADCLPVLLAVRDGSAVAAAHCGWRGLARGVLEATVRALGLPGEELCAWLGPAIGPRAFAANARGRWQCDLFELARQRLAALGIAAVFGGGVCTHADPQRFFSYRRDGRCGRMAALIWLAGPRRA
jgi:copper oxidase (laccase) domain-containing protein